MEKKKNNISKKNLFLIFFILNLVSLISFLILRILYITGILYLEIVSATNIISMLVASIFTYFCYIYAKKKDVVAGINGLLIAILEIVTGGMIGQMIGFLLSIYSIIYIIDLNL
jgi:hypothetical protein